MTESSRSDPELDRAIKEAVQSVEARERGPDTTDPHPPTDGAADAPGSLDEARVALLNAKRELQETAERTKKDLGEMKDRWLRTAADLENYKKRSAREREEVVKFGLERVLKDLLPVLDDLDRTLQAAEVSAKPEDSQLGTFIDGLRLVQRKFLSQLEKSGAETFPVQGISFDPNLHEAVQQVSSETVPAGGVVSELRRGFMLNGRLLRPALVVVSLGPAS